MTRYRRCTKCVLDTIANPYIEFDEIGISKSWKVASELHKKYVLTKEESAKRNQELVDQVKEEGRNNEYDCLIGLSGGVDSSYVAVWAKDNGLRPLAVHFDNGWNSEIAVTNIKNICDILDIDLITYVVNWEEFVDLQRAMLKASVVDIETVTDNSHKAVSLGVAKKHNIKYMISGANIATENMMPRGWKWNKQDVTNIFDIHKKFGERPIKSYKTIGQLKWFIMRHTGLGPQYVTPLNNLNFKKFEAMELLKERVQWQYYGGKHYESIWTKFYQAFILPTKFNIDKRKVHLSSLILNREITRDEALAELDIPLYDPDELEFDKEYVLKKLRFTESEFDKILTSPIKLHTDYKSDKKIMDFMLKIWFQVKPLIKKA